MLRFLPLIHQRARAQRPDAVWTQSDCQVLQRAPPKIDAVVVRLVRAVVSNSDSGRAHPVPRAEALTDLCSACFSDWRS